MKPSIRKQDGRWTVQRPGYGFNPGTSDDFDSWREAVGSLRSAPASAAPMAERGSHTLALPYGRTARGTIRLEET